MAAANEIVNTRLVPATREQIWEAWTDPALLARWWGPKGFTNTFHVCEPRPDGAWEYTMHGPDGTDYANRSAFRELEQPERIVIEHIEPMHRFLLTATFETRGAQTFLTFRMAFDTVEECERVRMYVPEANEQNLDRLEAVLAEAGE